MWKINVCSCFAIIKTLHRFQYSITKHRAAATFDHFMWNSNIRLNPFNITFDLLSSNWTQDITIHEHTSPSTSSMGLQRSTTIAAAAAHIRHTWNNEQRPLSVLWEYCGCGVVWRGPAGWWCCGYAAAEAVCCGWWKGVVVGPWSEGVMLNHNVWGVVDGHAAPLTRKWTLNCCSAPNLHELVISDREISIR